nr:T9SS type A sorting domain-containing protein [Bacteroidota bacterium]
MNKKVFLTAILLTAFSVNLLHAQRNMRGERPPDQKEMNPEMRAYLVENIIPLMKIQRHELDKSLSKQEIARLEEIRSELKSLKKIRNEKRNALHQSQDKPTVEQRQEMRKMRNQVHEMMNEVAIMAENHDTEITVLLDAIRPELEKWKLGMKDIRRENCQHNPGQQQAHNRNKKNRSHDGNMRPNHGNGHSFGMKRMLSPEGFLLWNPDDPLPFENGTLADPEQSELNLFPNPATNEVQISVMINEDSRLEISIMDNEGNFLNIIGTENAAEGLFSKTIDVSNFDNGLYFLQVKIGEESIIKRLIIQK